MTDILPSTMSFLSLSAPKSVFGPPPLLYVLRTQPIKTLIRLLDYLSNLLRSRPKPGSPPLRVVCVSDTHCLKTPYIPDGDLLIHAGDLTNKGTPQEIQAQIDWLDSLRHEHKIVVAGNHDTYLDPRSRSTLPPSDQKGTIDWKSLHYLQHTSTALNFASSGRTLRIHGAPQIPACGGPEHAFQYPRGRDAWSDTVPSGTDILVTHTPAKHHLDLPAALGCEHLLAELWRVQPRLHVFGHVHAGRSDLFGSLKGGREAVRWDERQARVERALGRRDGFFAAMLDPRAWMDLVKISFYGVVGAVWTRIWGGEMPRSTVMVLASLMYCDSGELRNEAQVVEI